MWAATPLTESGCVPCTSVARVLGSASGGIPAPGFFTCLHTKLMAECGVHGRERTLTEVPISRFRFSIALLAFSGTLLVVVLVFGYLATDGWYDVQGALTAIGLALPFAGVVTWMSLRVRAQARGYQGPLPSYLSILGRAVAIISVLATCAAIAGLIAASNTMYGGIIFVATLVVGTPLLSVCTLLMTWLARIFAQACVHAESLSGTDRKLQF